MHFEILVEDQSGKRALDILVPKIISDEHSYRVFAYKGIGKVPKNLKIVTERKAPHVIKPATALASRVWQCLQSTEP